MTHIRIYIYVVFLLVRITNWCHPLSATVQDVCRTTEFYKTSTCNKMGPQIIPDTLNFRLFSLLFLRLFLLFGLRQKSGFWVRDVCVRALWTTWPNFTKFGMKIMPYFCFPKISDTNMADALIYEGVAMTEEGKLWKIVEIIFPYNLK